MEENSNGPKTNDEKKVSNCYKELGGDWERLFVRLGVFRNS